MPVSFDIPGCAIGGCTACGGCTKMAPLNASKNSEYDPAKAPGQTATVLWETGGVATWYTEGKIGVAAVVTFSFSGTAGASVGFNQDSWTRSLTQEWGIGSNWRDFTEHTKESIKHAAEVMSSVSGLKLIYVDDPSKADMVWHYGTTAGLPKQLTAAFNPDWHMLGSDIIVNDQYSEWFETLDLNPGGFAFATFMHEFGHAVGMKHPFFGQYQLPRSIENRGTTIMSHMESPDGIYRSSPADLDQQALQYIYGTTTDRMTLGVKWSQLAKGGMISEGDDAGRVLKGIRDKDYIIGGSGNDRLIGYQGNDTLNGAGGVNVIEGGVGKDVLELSMLAKDAGNLHLTIWQDPRERGAWAGILQTKDGINFSAGIEGIGFADGMAWLSAPSLPTKSNQVSLVRSYNLIFKQSPNSNVANSIASSLTQGKARTDIIDTWLKSPQVNITGSNLTSTLDVAWNLHLVLIRTRHLPFTTGSRRLATSHLSSISWASTTRPMIFCVTPMECLHQISCLLLLLAR